MLIRNKINNVFFKYITKWFILATALKFIFNKFYMMKYFKQILKSYFKKQKEKMISQCFPFDYSGDS